MALTRLLLFRQIRLRKKRIHSMHSACIQEPRSPPHFPRYEVRNDTLRKFRSFELYSNFCNRQSTPHHLSQGLECGPSMPGRGRCRNLVAFLPNSTLGSKLGKLYLSFRVLGFEFGYGTAHSTTNFGGEKTHWFRYLCSVPLSGDDSFLLLETGILYENKSMSRLQFLCDNWG
jgi:hypothetical protein